MKTVDYFCHSPEKIPENCRENSPEIAGNIPRNFLGKFLGNCGNILRNLKLLPAGQTGASAPRTSELKKFRVGSFVVYVRTVGPTENQLVRSEMGRKKCHFDGKLEIAIWICRI